MPVAYVVTAVVQIVLGTAVPIGLGVWLARRAKVRWSSFGLGALAFVLSQVVHLPLNVGLSYVLDAPVLALPPAWGIVASATILGLSAGVCEETARWVLFRTAAERRDRDEALMVGLGHGGIESILFGTVATLFGLAQIVAIDRMGGAAAAGLSPEETAALEAGLATIRAQPFSPLVAAAERLMVIPFHVSASMLVVYGVVRGKRWALPAAIGWHALLDGVSVWVMRTFEPMDAEVWCLLTVPVSLVIIAFTWRALPGRAPVDPAIAGAAPSGAPLELFRATKRYDAVTALEEATLVLESGARTCLLGPNGAGKTTTIRLALGALAPTTGRVWLFGAEESSAELVEKKRRTGVVPQQPGMYEDLTVREYLELVRALYQKGDLDRIVDELDLAPMLDRPMSKHSGGQQRRIALAAALLPEPDLLVLDEPSAGLDPIAQKAMREMLRKVGAGRTVLLCTHDLDEAEALSERVVVLERGHVKVHERIDVLRAAKPARLRVRAQQPAATIAAALEAAGAPGGVADGTAVVAPLPGGRERVPAILRALLAASVDVEECIVLEATLEEIFLDAVGPRGPSSPPEAR